ncbi:14802_t:CDS:1 [Funneliformis caledonium]|uniref:14802_t:CDS:1 n=1 Tax=Funneliformis caledonium TaxID=1117310 RepID=A0A9N8Z572_9GLOM|nr:14802_t:CDS:1 [Funneliformis caledonium]
MEPLSDETTLPPHHYRAFSNEEHTKTERPKLHKRRLSSYDRNDYKREMYHKTYRHSESSIKPDNNDTTTAIDTSTATTIITLDNTVGFSSQLSPIGGVVYNDNGHETSGKEITDEFLSKDWNTPVAARGDKEE